MLNHNMAIISGLLLALATIVLNAGSFEDSSFDTEVMFVAPGVKDYQRLVELRREGVSVFILDKPGQELEQISRILKNFEEIDAIHLLTHGQSASIQLGSILLTSETLDRYQDILKSWSDDLSETADFFIYGCNVAEGDSGREFINQLSNLIGADVTASDNFTGKEGDWVLEQSTGLLETQIFALRSELEGYNHSLPIVLTSPSTEWAPVLSNDIFDVGQDTQAVAAVDLVGSAAHTHYYMKFDDAGNQLASDDEVAFRFRADNVLDNQGRFAGYVWIGMDVDSDDDIDVFMMLVGKNGAYSLDVYDSGTGTNVSPSTTDIARTGTPVETGFAFNHSLINSIDATGNPDIDGDTDPDYFVTYKVNFDALAAAVNSKTLTGSGATISTLNGVGFTKETQFKLVVASAQNDNALNGDIGGYDDANDDPTVTYADKFAFSGSLSLENPVPVLTADAGQSIITANPVAIAADGISTSTITVQLKNAIGTDLGTGGDSVVLISIAGSLGLVTDNGNGSYSATLTSSTTAETATISGTVNGAAIVDTASVVFTGVADITPPVITLLGNNPESVELGSTYSDAGATAADNIDGDISVNIVSGGTVNTAAVGAYTLTYDVSDAAGNAATQVTRTVNVTADVTAPVITLSGNNPESIELGSIYTDAGATAVDNIDGDISANIVSGGTVNTAAVGAYTLTYDVSDAAGNAATQVTRTVNVTADVTAPVITLSGNNTESIELGSIYTDAGATAVDNIDGDISANIVSGGTVNTAAVGAYTLTYDVSDAAGNAATQVTRTVNVTADVTAPVITLSGNNTESIELGSIYTDAGATAVDNIDGDISANIVSGGTVNTAAVGAYTLTYDVSDAAGNAATQVTRTVNVTADVTAPVITLSGNNTESIELGSIYTDAGATAVDNIDGDISANIVSGGTVNTAAVGAYTLTYDVSDAAGNAATQVTRAVNVTLFDPAQDQDGDGISNGDEGAGDSDGDGVPDFLDTDSDNDGITDFIEGNGDSDADGIADYLDLDSDNDGIFDLIESGSNYAVLDTNNDGRIDVANAVGANGLADVVETAVDSGTLSYNGGAPLDSDADGIEDYLDLDSDNDGLTDVIEAGGSDPDGDGIVGTGVAAVDADGVATAGAALNPVDTDDDSVNDQLDLDSDNDGIMDVVESGGSDADGDGQIATAPPAVDAFGVYIGGSLLAIDSDGDGVTNAHDLDSDNDGIPDVIEAGGSDPDGDGIAGSGVPAVNTQGIAAGVILNPGDIDGDLNADPYDPDSDGDGEFDLVEAGGIDVDNNGQVDGFSDTDGNGFDDGITVSALPLINTDSDGDGIPDYKDTDDADNDGIADAIDVDDDNDGIPDALEGDGAVDTDGDGVADSLDLDSDNDGIYDLVESGAQASVLDSNNDGQIDGSRVFGANGLADDIETVADSGSIAYNGGVLRDTDGDLINDYQDLDSDNDGLPDVIEAGGSDADGDGRVGDGSQLIDANGVSLIGAGLVPVDSDGDGKPNHRDLDSDNDGISDIREAGGTDIDDDGRVDGFTDANADGFDDVISASGLPINDADGNGIPDYLDNTDTDNDGVPDTADLDNDNDGITDLVEGNGDSDADGIADYLDLDSDNDGIFDLVESGSNYAVLDTNNDGRIDVANAVGANGLADVVETAVDSGTLSYNGGAPLDSDADGIEDYLDLDSDNDGLTDVIEAGGSDPDGDGIVGTGVAAVDADGVATAGAALNPVDTDGDSVNDQLDLDSDNDGIMDVVEFGGSDPDGDGQIATAPPAVDAFGVYVGGSLLAIDSDGDGITNQHDLDSDNDGIPDVIEAGGSDPDGDGIAGSGVPAVNTQGIAAGVILNPGDIDGDLNADPYDTDSDGDGEFDLVEAGGIDVDNNGQVDGFSDTDGNGFDDGITVSALPLINTDSDGDGIPDYKDTDDADNDGIADAIDVDDDNDGIPDTLEGDGAVDTDGDGVADSLDLDSDNDGIMDVVESGGNDPDGDGQIDSAPTAVDAFGLYIGGSLLTIDSDGDGVTNAHDLDSDNDGIPDVIEAGGSDPDGDGNPGSGVPVVNAHGIAAGVILNPTDIDGDLNADPYDSDSDGDGEFDLVEAGGVDVDNNGRVDSFSDTDGNGFDDGIAAAALPLIAADTDFDGTPDYRDNLDDRGMVLTGLKGIGSVHPGFILLLLAVLLFRKLGVRKRLLILLLPVAVFQSHAQQSDQFKQADERSWYLGGAMGYSIMSPDTDDSIYSLDKDTDFGKRIFAGLDLSSRISLEMSLSDLGTSTLKPVGEIDYQVWSFNFLYYAYQEEEEDHTGMSAYLKLLGLSKIENDATIPYRLENSIQISLGFGLEYGWQNGFAIRGDLESFDEDAAILSVALMYRFGLSEPLPVRPDSDRDGVYDDADRCRDTPQQHQSVDNHGCEFDSDSDGVIDRIDQCPQTPAKIQVDSRGCELDSDKDGVVDRLDECPQTPIGKQVNAKGCLLDSDRDGVVNELDECPQTKNGVRVDETGCSLDADSDGVLNDLDECPQTIEGLDVNDAGCAFLETEIDGVNFKLGSAELTVESEQILDNVAELLLGVPSVVIEIQAHTDSQGQEQANMKLSEERAKSVKVYLESKGVLADRMEIKGYGESSPLVSNKTVQGRAKNRRVEFRVIKGPESQ